MTDLHLIVTFKTSVLEKG